MNRIKAAFHVLRGRPLMYRMRIAGGLSLLADSKNALVTECVFIGPGKPTLRRTISQCRDLLVKWWRLRK